ncbi:MAG: TRAP transporter small permease [Spirochaetales bacterium]|nr:TRAP transporter small permease [Spirochaetales bacterium]
MNKILRSWHGLEGGISRVLEFLVTLAFALIVVLTVLLVILRYLFNSSIIFGNELMEFLFIYTTAFGAAVSLGKGNHIKIDYFKDRLNPPLKLIAEIAGQLIIGAINIIIAVLSLNWIAKVGHSASPVMRIPMWTVQICIPLGCVLVTLFALFNITKALEHYAHRKDGAAL